VISGSTPYALGGLAHLARELAAVGAQADDL
jgi:hypothetical protein